MKKFKIEVKWALIFTLIFLAWMSFEHLMGWHDEAIENERVYTNLFGILAILVYILEIREKREKYYKGIMTWQQGFLSGAILSVIITAFTPISQYIVHTFISPNRLANLIDYNVSKNLMQPEIAAQYYSFSTYLFQSAFFTLSAGIVTAAIVALFFKTKKTESNKA